MRRPAAPGRPVVVKVGSSSLAPTGTGLDPAAPRRVAEGVAAAWGRGHPTVLVTSGAVAVGVAALGWPTRPDDPATLKWRRRPAVAPWSVTPPSSIERAAGRRTGAAGR